MLRNASLIEWNRFDLRCQIAEDPSLYQNEKLYSRWLYDISLRPFSCYTGSLLVAGCLRLDIDVHWRCHLFIRSMVRYTE